MKSEKAIGHDSILVSAEFLIGQIDNFLEGERMPEEWRIPFWFVLYEDVCEEILLNELKYEKINRNGSQ